MGEEEKCIYILNYSPVSINLASYVHAYMYIHNGVFPECQFPKYHVSKYRLPKMSIIALISRVTTRTKGRKRLRSRKCACVAAVS